MDVTEREGEFRVTEREGVREREKRERAWKRVGGNTERVGRY